MDHQATAEGRIPTLHIVADSIPQAHYRAMKAVWEQGFAIRTEYDRKDSRGKYIDPPGRDARVLIEVTDPFRQPRFPPVSFCEIGVYIAEIMGLKDYRVVPMERLKAAVTGEFSASEWPYTYHQRLCAHPDVDGSTVDQLELVVERVARTPYTRRAVATTAVPNIDPYLKEDIPCLREIQLRCPEDQGGNLVANMSTAWRSRDLFKAWPDNVIALTFLQSVLARQVAEKTRRKVRVGSYADYSFSLHIYGRTSTRWEATRNRDCRASLTPSTRKPISPGRWTAWWPWTCSCCPSCATSCRTANASSGSSRRSPSSCWRT
jgi:thymidylate synthase